MAGVKTDRLSEIILPSFPFSLLSLPSFLYYLSKHVVVDSIDARARVQITGAVILSIVRVVRDIWSSLVKVGHPDFAWDGLGREGGREGGRDEGVCEWLNDKLPSRRSRNSRMSRHELNL